jgi:hypothetical protein
MVQVAHATSAVSPNAPVQTVYHPYARRVPKVLRETRERAETKEYLDDLLNMYKSVFQVSTRLASSSVLGV